MKSKLIVEFIGTFFLVFAIGMSVITPGAEAFAPIAIGLTLMVMVYAGGHISGAHYNPAATLGIFLRGKCPPADVLPYIGVQILGALAAAFLVTALKPDLPSFLKGMNDKEILPVFIVEFLFTFALVWVILNVATAKSTEGNSYFGLAIGGTVMAGAFAVGPVSGAAFNPAVVAGLGVMGLVPWGLSWVYLIATFAGGATAALAYRLVNGQD